jgi:general stress protein 26
VQGAQLADKNQTDTLYELIKDIRFAMFTTRGADGNLRSRPMTTQGRPEGQQDCLWFFASRGSEPVADLQREPSVNVAYADTGRDAYVSVSGSASIVEDGARKQELWSKFAEAWFPGGPEDPDLALIRVQIGDAEYWNVKESKAVQLFKMARATVTGKPPTDLGDHAKLER